VKAKPGEIRQRYNNARRQVDTRFIGEFVARIPTMGIVRHAGADRSTLPYVQIDEKGKVTHGHATPRTLGEWGDLVKPCGAPLAYEQLHGMRVHIGDALVGRVYRYRCSSCGVEGTNNGKPTTCPGFVRV